MIISWDIKICTKYKLKDNEIKLQTEVLTFSSQRDEDTGLLDPVCTHVIILQFNCHNKIILLHTI